MPAVNQDVAFYEGETRTIRIPIRMKDGITPKPVTDAQYIHAWVGKNSRSTGAEVILRKSVGSGISFVEGDDPGLIDVAFDPADTQGKEGAYYWEVEVKDNQGVVAKTTIGQFKITGSSGGDYPVVP